MKRILALILTLLLVLSLAACSAETTGIYAPLSNSDLQNKSLADVIEEFENAGFKYVFDEAIEYEFGNEEYSDGDIIEVLINGAEVDADTKYNKDDKVELFYARVPFTCEVTFGTYEQDCNGATEDGIVWYVLKTDGDKCLLVSKEILDFLPFNDTAIVSGTSWGNSTLRSWLNGSFYDSAFTEEEKSQIYNTSVQDYKSDNKLGDITTDKVFILNYDEAMDYFPDSHRSSKLTNYAKSRKEITSDAWWLINSYSSDLYKYAINSNGQHENEPRVNESQGVRPAIWVDSSILD